MPTIERSLDRTHRYINQSKRLRITLAVVDFGAFIPFFVVPAWYCYLYDFAGRSVLYPLAAGVMLGYFPGHAAGVIKGYFDGARKGAETAVDEFDAAMKDIYGEFNPLPACKQQSDFMKGCLHAMDHEPWRRRMHCVLGS